MGQVVDAAVAVAFPAAHCRAASGRLSRFMQQLYALRVSPQWFNTASAGGYVAAANTCNVAVAAVPIVAWRGAEGCLG